MKMKLFFLIPLFILFTVSLYSQVQQEWVQRYNGPGSGPNYANSIAVDGSGNVYVTGGSTGSGTGSDYATIKYNTSGVQQWIQRYNGPGNGDDWGNSLAVDSSGNVYVTGISMGSGTGYDYATIKYNANGIQQWVQRYNGPGNGDDYAYSITVEGLGNVYVTGSSMGSGTGNDYATIKYNTDGIQQWIQRYNGLVNGDDGANSIAVAGSGNVYITGWSAGNGTSYDYTTIKYSATGVQQWVQRYDGPVNGDDVVSSLTIDGSENVYLTGSSYGSGTGKDYATIKYNASGVQQWVQRYNGTGNGSDYAKSIAVDGSGNVYVTGYSSGNGTGNDYATIKYNASGVQQWVQRYNGTGNGNDVAYSLVVEVLGNVYVTGSSLGSVTGNDYATIKYNASGVQQWIQTYNGPGDSTDYSFTIAVDGSGNVYVAGQSCGVGAGYDYATIKYSQNIGIKRISSEVPEKYALYQNYPNPFNPSTKIKFQIPLSPLSERGAGGFITLKIYDLLGREVATLVNEHIKSGIYEVTWDASAYSSGVYFYKIEAGSYIQTKKMMLLK